MLLSIEYFPEKTFFQIRDFILSGNIKEAEKVINSAYPELLDDDHLLHFYLQIQHLIELIRRKQIEQAVVFAQEDIVEKGDYPECLPDLERVMGLLAYPEPEKSPFSDLLKQNFRLKVWSRVNEGLVTKSRIRPSVVTLGPVRQHYITNLKL